MGRKSNFENNLKTYLKYLVVIILLSTCGCRLVDGKDPGNADTLILSSMSIDANCPSRASVAETYNCQPKLTIAAGVNPSQLMWEFSPSNTCTWLKINPATGQVFGVPDKMDLGNCVSSVRVITSQDTPAEFTMGIAVAGPKINFVTNNCSTTVAVDKNYSCDYDATTPLTNANLIWSLAADNACTWATINPTTGVVTGTPPLASVGKCALSLSVSVDKISSANLKVDLTIPQVAVTVNLACIANIEAGTAFSCLPKASADLTNPQFSWSLSPANTCAWAAVDSMTGQISGTPAIYSTGTCRLDVTAKLANGSSGQNSISLKISTKGYNENFLTESEGGAGVKSGSAVAIDGNWAAIGSPEDFDGAGSVSLYKFDGSNWRKYATLTSPSPTTIMGFGYSVAISGTSLLIGAPYSKTKSFNEGAIVAYNYDGMRWNQNQVMVPNFSQSQVLLHFGSAIAVDGPTAVVATSHYLGEAAYILTKTNDLTWVVAQSLPFVAVASAEGPSRMKVALHSGLAVVSDTSGGAVHAGEIRLFRANAGQWNLDGVITATDGAELGAAVATFNGRVLLGAPGDRFSTGAAYLYEKSGNSWSITKTIKAVDEATSRRFGQSVALHASQIVIGAPSTTIAGSAYVYKKNTNDWLLDSKLMPTIGNKTDKFGISIGLTGTQIIVGAPALNYNALSQTGGAFAFNPK